MMRIFLTGYMGAGKTTLGKAFAREMNVPFIDLDWYIEERFHKSIRELFTERGEASFRELERNMLHEVGEFEDVVVSTGGGTPCFFDNMEYMNGCGQTVFLDVLIHGQVAMTWTKQLAVQGIVVANDEAIVQGTKE